MWSNSICVSFARLHAYNTSYMHIYYMHIIAEHMTHAVEERWRVDTNRPENQIQSKGHPKCTKSRSREKHPFPSPCRTFSRIGNLLPKEPQLLVPHFHTFCQLAWEYVSILEGKASKICLSWIFKSSTLSCPFMMF